MNNQGEESKKNDNKPRLKDFTKKFKKFRPVIYAFDRSQRQETI